MPLPSIGFVGTGVMGSHMARHLMAAGYPLHINTRTRSKGELLLAAGARWVDHAAELPSRCQIIFTMVGFPSDVEALYLGAQGLLTHRREGDPLRLLIDCTTSSPDLACRIAAQAKLKNLEAIDAPVSGGEIGARDATLSIMVGGSAEGFQLALPFLTHLGKKVIHQGKAGLGQHTKMVNQILIATNMIGVCEGLIYASRAGLVPEKVIESVGSGAAGSWSVNNLAPRIVRRDFEPGFYVEHFIKDLRIALDEASRMRISLPGLALAHQLYEAVRAQGYESKGTQALYLALEQLNRK